MTRRRRSIAPLPAPADHAALAAYALTDAQLLSERSKQRLNKRLVTEAQRAREHFAAVNEIFNEAKRGGAADEEQS